MTVALAFKAFAKAIPCLTPFFARFDPSVLKRILAYPVCPKQDTAISRLASAPAVGERHHRSACCCMCSRQFMALFGSARRRRLCLLLEVIRTEYAHCELFSF